MNKEELYLYLEKLKIERHNISEGTDNGIPYLYVEISEHRKVTINKLIKIGFQFRIRIPVNGEYNKFNKEYQIRL